MLEDAMGTQINTSFSHLDSSHVSLMNESQKSPDLFESDEENNDDIEIPSIPEETAEVSNSDSEICKRKCDIRDERRNKIMRMTLAGVPPPPKFTIPQYTAAEMLQMFKTNGKISIDSNEEKSASQKTNSSEIISDLTSLKWPTSLDCEYYDVYYNRGHVSTDLESLCDKYRVRYVGCETSSTVIDKSSNTEHLMGSAKKKAKKHPWNYSPGRRLSHLARRRQMFTSANIAKAAVGSRIKSSLGADSRKMFFVDKKKPVNNFMSRSKLANLSSIASTSGTHQNVSKLKQNIMTSSQMPSLKRALFQSPDLSSKFQNNPHHNSSSLISKETPRTDKNKARRALFSSASKKDSKTPSKKTPNKKTPRKTPQRKTPHKTTPTSSRKKTPRKCLFADQEDGSSSRELFNANGKRLRSESMQNLAVNDNAKKICLSSDEKKKLLWVVYHCLKEKKISSRNEIYKSCQNYLYKMCSDAWKNQKEDASQGSNKITNVSEKMLNIARKYVSGVILKVKNKSFYSKTQVSELTSECGDSIQQKDFDDRSSVQGSSVCEKSDYDCGKSESSVKQNTDQSSSSYHGDDDTNTTGSAYLNQDEDTNMSEVTSSVVDDQTQNTEKLTQFKISCSSPPADCSISTLVTSVRCEPYPQMPTLVAESSYRLPKLSGPVDDSPFKSIPTLLPEVPPQLPHISLEMPSLPSFCPEMSQSNAKNLSQHSPSLTSILPNFGSDIIASSQSPSGRASTRLSPSLCSKNNIENSSLVSNTPEKKYSPSNPKFKCSILLDSLCLDEDTRF